MTPRILICISIIAVCIAGCDPGIVTSQSWRIQVTSTEDQAPIPDLRIVYADDIAVRDRILNGESIEDANHRVDFYTDSNGIALITEDAFRLCAREPPPGKSSCPELAMMDFNTGTTKRYYVGENDDAELIELNLEVGNSGQGDLYTIEVLEIGPPELLVDYTAEE